MEQSRLSQRVKDLRNHKGFSQEQLAENSGLSIRTIQRIENGESEPRGDTLNRLAKALQVSPDEILDWQLEEDRGFLTLMNLSGLAVYIFPLGIILPLVLWILKKDKIKDVNEMAKAILNFQITWTIFFFLSFILVLLVIHRSIISVELVILGFYAYNTFLIIVNTIRCQKGKAISYKPAIPFLR